MEHSLPSNNKKEEQLRIEQLYQHISTYIDKAHQNILRSVNTEMVKTYWIIGQSIVEEEQRGASRAEYGKSILKELATKLQTKYQRGFGVDTLENARKFYLTYALEYKMKKSDTPSRKSAIPEFAPSLSWSHYRELIKIKRPEARRFYEIETIKNNWSLRELRRQVDSLLFDRLNKSKNQQGLLELACKGQEVSNFEDTIKEPVVLEFLRLPESHLLVESKLESAIIANLQQFLLELGKGFAFVARQKRLSLDGDYFYADLVFYHIILKCYVIIDIKTHALTHQDLGQMQLYVNYYDQEIKQENDNPTIGLVLCTEKNDTVVRYTLGEKAKQIFASKYQFHLPTEKELETELKREIKALTEL